MGELPDFLSRIGPRHRTWGCASLGDVVLDLLTNRIELGLVIVGKDYGDEELLLYVEGTPPETENAEILDSVV